MIALARERCEREGWRNVSLVQSTIEVEWAPRNLGSGWIGWGRRA